MALDGDTLGVAIANAIIADSISELNTEEQTMIVDKWKIIANQIVNHITGSAQVQPGTFVVSHDGTHPVNGIGTIT